MKMKKEMLEGKKIRVVLGNKDFFYSVIKIIDITNSHVIFIDKFGIQKIIRQQDIAEVFENRKNKKTVEVDGDGNK